MTGRYALRRRAPRTQVTRDLKPRFFCPRCGGLLKRKDVATLLDQLPCRKCGYNIGVAPA